MREGAYIMDFQNMDSLHLDVLKEIGNIGAGHAVNALSLMLGKKIDMAVPKVNILEFKDVSKVLGDPEELVFGVLVPFEGELNGMMMFIFKLESARILINALMGSHITDVDEFGEMDISALKEIGNILSGSYLSALHSLVGKKVGPSIPNLAKDMAGAILSVPAIEFGIYTDQVMFIESVFDAGTPTVGYFILVPDEESFKIILKALGVG